MRYAFYDSAEYRTKQSQHTKRNTARPTHTKEGGLRRGSILVPRVERVCENPRIANLYLHLNGIRIVLIAVLHMQLEWVYEPKSFDIGNQMYTPDLYLPEFYLYVEVKNFWNDYSSNRDSKFRRTFPELKIEVLLKKSDLEIQDLFSEFIPSWEYNNGSVPI